MSIKLELSQTKIHPIILPNEISWMPQTLSWLLVLIFFILLIICLVWAFVQHHNKNKYKTEALSKLDEIEQKLNSKSRQCLNEVPLLIRQVALSYWPRRNIVSLSGRNWHEFLQMTSNTMPPKILDEVAYLSHEQLNRISHDTGIELIAWARSWILNHQKYNVGVK